MVGAETPCPRTPGNQSRRFPPSDKPTGPPSATGAWGSQRLIYFAMSFIASLLESKEYSVKTEKLNTRIFFLGA
jgi:hypothetical protein